MKTALEQAIGWFNELKKDCKSMSDLLSIETTIFRLQKLLPTEREQIEAAYLQGEKDGINDADGHDQDYENASDYFNQTYTK